MDTVAASPRPIRVWPVASLAAALSAKAQSLQLPGRSLVLEIPPSGAKVLPA